jgi:hypothetical protein
MLNERRLSLMKHTPLINNIAAPLALIRSLRRLTSQKTKKEKRN